MSNTVDTEQTVSSTQLRDCILYCAQLKEPLFIWGGPGIGKSNLVHQVAEELGGFTIDVRLGQYDPTDIKGMPFLSRITLVDDDGNEVEKESLSWAPSGELPTPEDTKNAPIVILFLDEMNHAAPMVQAASFQLILDRRVGQYQLPENVVVVAAGNRQSDKGATYSLAGPLKNRFIHYHMEAEFEPWRAWAVQSDIADDVIGYLSFAQDNLYNFDSATTSNSFPTPRSWAKVSRLVKPPEGVALPSEEVLEVTIAGTIGAGAAGEFIEQRKLAKQLPNPDDIIAGTAPDLPKTFKGTDGKERQGDDTALQHILATSVCGRLYKIHKVCIKNRGSKPTSEKVPVETAKGKKPKMKRVICSEMRPYYKALDFAMHYMERNFETEMLVAVVGMVTQSYKMELVPSLLSGNVFADILDQIDDLLDN